MTRSIQTASRSPGSRARRLSFLLFGVALVTMMTLGCAGLARLLTLRAFRIAGGSMATTLIPGDMFFADTAAYGLALPGTSFRLRARRPDRGDVAVFLHPRDKGVSLVERVVALEGEAIAIDAAGQAFIDGRLLVEPYATFEPDAHEEQSRSFGPHVVAPGHFFALGDNRDASFDSRRFGDVPRADLIGRAAVIYWSVQPVVGSEEPTIRWDRIGRAIR